MLSARTIANWGVVSTVRADGSPHATPVWVDTDGENLLFNTAIGGAKERHLRRDPRVTVTVIPSDDPQSGYVSVTGHAKLEESGAQEHIDFLAKKYLGQERYPFLAPGERRVIVSVSPERIDALGFD